MTVAFAKPTSVYSVPERKAGGDNQVPRDGNDKPIIRLVCTNEKCEGGRVPSEKRPGNTVQCPKCKGKGEIERSYKRASSFGEVLEDKTQLMAWQERKVLIGVAMDPSFINGVLDKNEDYKQDKDFLNRRAKSAAELAGAQEKAKKGTYKHGLSELIDRGEPLPDGVSFGDIIDMDDYARRTKPILDIRHMEELIVLDEFGIAGTPDRVSEPLVELEAPDGSIIGPGQLLITDLKTGSVDYGGLKMCCQLTIYSRGKLYTHLGSTPAACRTDFALPVNQQWGIIMNLPADSGELEMHWADLELGWAALNMAEAIRQMRNRGRKALTRMVVQDTSTEVDTAA